MTQRIHDRTTPPYTEYVEIHENNVWVRQGDDMVLVETHTPEGRKLAEAIIFALQTAMQEADKQKED